MTCAACPITVKHALSKRHRRQKSGYPFRTEGTIVTFDDGKTNVQALTEATADASYPSSVKE